MPTSPKPLTAHQAIADTVRWLERAVIALNLCPFAKAPHVKGRIHFSACMASDAQAWQSALATEMQALLARPASERETTLLVVPNALHDFVEFNDSLRQAEKILRQLKLQGVLQIASFHPFYQFADTPADDITNYTNRSPYPVFHLLREDSIDQAVAVFPEAKTIFEANIQTLRELGPSGWKALGVGPSS